MTFAVIVTGRARQGRTLYLRTSPMFLERQIACVAHGRRFLVVHIREPARQPKHLASGLGVRRERRRVRAFIRASLEKVAIRVRFRV